MDRNGELVIPVSCGLWRCLLVRWEGQGVAFLLLVSVLALVSYSLRSIHASGPEIDHPSERTKHDGILIVDYMP